MQVRGNNALHKVDRYVGIPAVALLGVLRRKRNLPSKIRRIGLLKAGAIGDTVLLTGPIADLRAEFPGAELILFAGESNYEMAGLLDGIAQVVKVPSGNPLQGIAAMRSVRVDLLLDFGQWSRLEALYAAFARASFTLGFRTDSQHRHSAYDRSIEHSAHQHELENYRDLIRALGVKAKHPPCLKPTPDMQADISGGPYVVCHQWAGGKRRELKQWPSEQWRRLISEISAWGLRVVLTGGPADHLQNEKIIASLPETSRVTTSNAAGLPLKRSTEILAGARLTVSVNTGVMHVAAALGVPVVGLQGPTSSKRWGPVGKNTIAIDSTSALCGYLNLGWEYAADPPPCMETVNYDAVRDACKLLCESYSSDSSAARPDEAALLETNVQSAYRLK
ncbi:MAG TPA: glycosyltransferase family 9 protein [Candidatus Saccharimonadales bacterium]|nr:glycosyltransferase family 9 protein [Candidatus Saccharimonadales bacterium]